MKLRYLAVLPALVAVAATAPALAEELDCSKKGARHHAVPEDGRLDRDHRHRQGGHDHRHQGRGPDPR